MFRQSLCKAVSLLLITAMLLAPIALGSPTSSADDGTPTSLSPEPTLWTTIRAVFVAVWVVYGLDSEEGEEPMGGSVSDEGDGDTTDMSPHADPFG